jgi:hypothetical protein
MNADLHRRYQLLAGPFSGNEARLLDTLCCYLRQTGARILTHPHPIEGTDLYRLRSECETMEETAERLRKQKLKS